MFTQLHTPLPVHVFDKAPGLAFAVIAYGPEHHLLWITALDDGGEIWSTPNPMVRMQANWSLQRTKATPAANVTPMSARDGARA